MNLALQFNETVRIRAVKYLLSRKLVRTLEDSEDCVQDALLSAWKHRAQFRGQSKFSSWFMRIVINAALMRKRHDSRGVPGHSRPISEEEWIPAPVRNTDPFRRKRLFRAMHKLTPRQQHTVICCYGYGFTLKELASYQAVTVGTIKTRANRAKKKLRHELRNVA